MTTAVATPPVVRRSPVGHALARQLRTAAVLALWFWAIVLVAVVIVSVSILRSSGSVDVSVVAYARQAATWFPFSQAVLLASLVRVHVAAGLTRRTFLRSTVVAAVATGLVHTVVMVAALTVERQVHAALGWGFEITERGLPGTGATVLPLLVEYGPGFVVANLAGLLVGTVYQRGGSWWGTLTLPLTVGPVLLTLGIWSGWFGPLPVGLWAQTSTTTHLVGAAVAAVLVTTAYALVARTAPVRTPR
ncbi:hypothetical protein [Cellulomonas sp. SLBN-39]|uniref:hypothetical protein n=1 Tax=Cellulomonas sp. SLBN-39 TaxID=2768446 RepID=UPI00115322AD|nr:hypothetical protein [Cellulomonas sp. SLBN-39]TQL02823.1 hypothetical protein FBY24_1909 [Cellulomonas sp. SLBN-39]